MNRVYPEDRAGPSDPHRAIFSFADVCQKVLFDRVGKENEFKEYFREAMRKLAAR